MKRRSDGASTASSLHGHVRLVLDRGTARGLRLWAGLLLLLSFLCGGGVWWVVLGPPAGRFTSLMFLGALGSAFLAALAGLAWLRTIRPVAVSESSGYLHVWPFLLDERRVRPRRWLRRLLTAGGLGALGGLFDLGAGSSPWLVAALQVAVLIAGLALVWDVSTRGLILHRGWLATRTRDGVQVTAGGKEYFFPGVTIVREATSSASGIASAGGEQSRSGQLGS